MLKLNFVYNPTGQSTKNNGNIHEQKITVTGLPSGFVTQQYTYDKVNRITQVTEGGWSRSYHYDAFGNRAMQGSVPSPAKAPLCVLDGVLGCSNTDPDVADRPAYDAATNRFNSDWAKYDAAGNVLWHKDPLGSATRQWSAAYDALNKQIYYCDGGIDPCTSGAATGRYSYDGAGNRVEKVVGSTTTTYVYDASGRLAAEYSNQAPTGAAKTLFRTVDHLGSTRLVSDANGDVVSRRDFFPFGEEIEANSTFGNRQLVLDGQGSTTYNASTSFAQRFTAKERDQESGLDYFGARYFSASLGRFTGVDAGPLRESDPQSLNRYAYVRNNPLRLIDEAGEYWVEATAVAGRWRFEVFRESPITASLPTSRLAPFEFHARRSRRDTNRGNPTPIIGNFLGFTFVRDETEVAGRIQDPVRYSIGEGVRLDKEVFDAFSQEFSVAQQEGVGGKPTSLVLSQGQAQTFTAFHTAFRFGKEIKKLEGRLEKATHPVDKARLERRISRRKNTEEYKRFGDIVSRYLNEDDEREE